MMIIYGVITPNLKVMTPQNLVTIGWLCAIIKLTQRAYVMPIDCSKEFNFLIRKLEEYF